MSPLLALLALSGAVEVEPALDVQGEVRQVVMTALRVSDDVPAPTRETVEGALVSEVRKLRGVVVFGSAELGAMLELEAERQVTGCTDASCLDELGDALGSDELVTSALQAVGESWVLELRRLDVKDARPIADATARVPAGDGEATLAAIGDLIARLYPAVELREGKTRGVPPELARKLNPPPVPLWATASVAGAGAACLVAAGGAALFWGTAQADFKALQDAEIVDGAALVQRRDAATAAYVTMWSLAGAGLVLGGISAALLPATRLE